MQRQTYPQREESRSALSSSSPLLHAGDDTTRATEHHANKKDGQSNVSPGAGENRSRKKTAGLNRRGTGAESKSYRKERKKELTITGPRDLGLGRAETNQILRRRRVYGSRPVVASAAGTARRRAAGGSGGCVQGEVFDAGVAGTEAELMVLLLLLLLWVLLLVVVRRVLVVLVVLLLLMLLMLQVDGDARGSPFPRHGPACRRRR